MFLDMWIQLSRLLVILKTWMVFHLVLVRSSTRRCRRAYGETFLKLAVVKQYLCQNRCMLIRFVLPHIRLMHGCSAHRETTSCGLPTPRPSIETIGVSTVRPSVAPAAGVPPRFPLPDLSHSPITPRTPNSEFPYTPADGVQALPLDSKPPIAGANQTTGERLDPFSIFVGGLEAVHWDDARLVSIFEQYGSIEDVRTVKPSKQPKPCSLQQRLTCTV